MPLFTGLLCECLELPYGLLDCSYVRPNLTTTTTEIITFTTTETTTIIETTSLSTTTEIPTTEIPTTIIAFTTEPISTELTTHMFDITTKINEAQDTVEPRTIEEISTTTEDFTNIIFPTTFAPQSSVINKSTEHTTEFTTITFSPSDPQTTTIISTSSEITDSTITTPSGLLNVTDISHFFTDEPDARPGQTSTESDTTMPWTSSSTISSTFTSYLDLTTSTATVVYGNECKNLFCENGGTCITTSEGAKVKVKSMHLMRIVIRINLITVFLKMLNILKFIPNLYQL